MDMQPSIPSTKTDDTLTKERARDIIDALNNQNIEKVRLLTGSLHAADIAELIDLVTQDQRSILIEAIKLDFDPEILIDVSDAAREEVISLLGLQGSAEAIIQLDTEDAVQVMEHLDEDDQQEILEAIPEDSREDLEKGLSYPEDSAGRLLQRNVVSIPDFWTVGDTIDFLRKTEDLPDDFYQVYAIDPKHHPIGAIATSRIMRSKRDIRILDIMDCDLRLIQTEMDQEEVAHIFRKYGLSSAPVVNDTGRLVGVIAVDDIVDVMQEEAEEDIMRLGGVLETDIHSYVMETARKRFPWLCINLLTAILASIVISVFEATIEQLVALAVLMPIVASMGGNAGTQTMTVAVRALATKELTATNSIRVLIKETLVGGVNGLLFAMIASAAVGLWYDNAVLSYIFALAIIITLLLAGLAGILIPLTLSRFRIDPAIASSVFLTTVTDVVAFSVFLGVAAWWF